MWSVTLACCPQVLHLTTKTLVSSHSVQHQLQPQAQKMRKVLWKTNKWIVNEPNIMELFKGCQECGLLITETRKTTVGSLLRVRWKCEQHKGRWSSCTDVRGKPVSACTLFTGATFTHINDWAAMLNLKTPKKTSYHDIQSSYLIPVINEEYQEQQKSFINDLHCQNELRNPVHLSDDGRSDSPGFSAKYNTYSLMDDTTDKFVHFELVQVTEASSSVAVEPIGFKRSVNKLLEKGIETDRHLLEKICVWSIPTSTTNLIYGMLSKDFPKSCYPCQDIRTICSLVFVITYRIPVQLVDVTLTCAQLD